MPLSSKKQRVLPHVAGDGQQCYLIRDAVDDNTYHLAQVFQHTPRGPWLHRIMCSMNAYQLAGLCGLTVAEQAQSLVPGQTVKIKIKITIDASAWH